MKRLLAAALCAIALLASSSTALADPPPWFLMAAAPSDGSDLHWLRCEYKGTWNDGADDVLPAAQSPSQIWIVGFHLAHTAPPSVASIADAYVCFSWIPPTD